MLSARSTYLVLPTQPIRMPLPIPIDLSWLAHDVPLWAWLLAAFTKPYTWSQIIAERLTPLVDHYLPIENTDG